MALLSKLFMALASAAAVLAQGRIDSLYEVDQSLRGHTVYRPRNMTAYAKMPVVVWGNGACSANGLSHVNFNLEVAAWGIILIAQGEPNQSGSTNSNQMKQAIDWISSNAGKGNYANVDASRIAAAGMSCGGTEAYAMVPDSRVKAYGIFNSGNLDEGSTNRIMPQINVPIFFFLGGPSDIAYNNGMRDYRAVRSGVPTWVGNLPVGHGGTYGDPRGGKFGTAGQQFFRWALRGDTSASGFFTSGGAQADGWTTESKNLGNLNASPLPTGTSAPTNVPTTAPTTAPNPTTTAAPQPTGNCAAKWGQCGGQGWSGSTCCAEGTCTKTNDWYSQCV